MYLLSGEVEPVTVRRHMDVLKKFLNREKGKITDVWKGVPKRGVRRYGTSRRRAE